MATPIDTLEEKLAIVQLELASLRTRVDILNPEFTALKTKIEALAQQIEALTIEIAARRKDVDWLKENVQALSVKVDALIIRHDKLSAEVKIISSNYVTKADLANALYQQTWRMAAFNGLLASICFAIARYA